MAGEARPDVQKDKPREGHQRPHNSEKKEKRKRTGESNIVLLTASARGEVRSLIWPRKNQTAAEGKKRRLGQGGKKKQLFVTRGIDSSTKANRTAQGDNAWPGKRKEMLGEENLYLTKGEKREQEVSGMENHDVAGKGAQISGK